ncbi:SCO2583 family membrane protein [Streptomyces sp. S6]
MGGPGDPPEGTPEGAPAGGEDEYRSVVFDESFVRAARLQEYSARERMGDHAPAVRRRPVPLRRGLSRQAVALVLLIMIAFGTAIYMSVRSPYQSPAARRAVEPLRMTVVPLAPQSAVPGAADAAVLYAHSPARNFRVGADGITLPAARRTEHFSESQIITALTTAKEYIVRSALYPEVVLGQQIRAPRVLVDSEQLDQFDASFSHPSADGLHAPTGWVVRFDPGQVRLADPGIRVRGTLGIAETDSETLEVTADHTFVYALRPAAPGVARISLFTVRRELHFRFDHEDLRLRQTQVLVSQVQAGPLACSSDAVGYLRPLLAGRTAGTAGPAGTDPYETGTTAALCGTLAGSALPRT